MFNMRGEVIGIISSILTRSGGFEGLGFAVTSNTASDVLFGSRMMWSGMTGILLEGDMAGAFNIPTGSGYLVQKVADGSPAKAIGLKAGVMPVTIGDRTILIGGDVILGVNRTELTRASFAQIRQAMAELRPGVGFTIQILRAGRRTDLVGVR
jgi:S1-C subfamily serine protease